MDAWPAGHTIGVYLSVGAEIRPVATARESGDVPRMLRHLAQAWETYGSLPIVEPLDEDVYFADL